MQRDSSIPKAKSVDQSKKTPSATHANYDAALGTASTCRKKTIAFWAMGEAKPQIKKRYGQASLSVSLIAALLKNTNASSVIYRDLTAMKVVDYCLGGWRHCTIVLNGQTGKNWTGILNLLADRRADDG